MSHLLLDLAGFELDAEDQEILTHPAIFGVILFTRNYYNLEQLKALTHAIGNVNPNLVILVDQEGGRVQRFREHFTSLPSMRDWGQQFCKNQSEALLDLKRMMITMVQELQHVGVHATLMPVLDIDYGISEIIGERSFSCDVNVINQLAQSVIEILHTYKMPATGKHFPGHGAVALDSHEFLPVDARDLTQICANDLIPYQKLIHQLDAIMPAHIVYSAVDDKPAGFSRIWLQKILREQLGFKGLIISDDIMMKATKAFGSTVDCAWLALEAGCDVVTVCNDRSEAIKVIDAIGSQVSPYAVLKAKQFLECNV